MKRTPTVRAFEEHAPRARRTKEDERALRDRVHLKARLQGITLQDLTEEDKIELSLIETFDGEKTGMHRLLELRKAAYITHVAAMAIPAPLHQWAGFMASTYGPEVQVWAQRLGWLEALMVARYGEEPKVWPTAFDEDDVTRAMRWALKNKWPKGVSHLLTFQQFEEGYIRTGLACLAFVVIALIGLLAPPLFPIVFGSALANFWENELIDHLFRNRSYTAPTAMHIALYTAAPGETGGGTEVSGGSYARVSYGTGATIWEGTGGETTATDSAGTGGGTQNINAITFPTPSANWGQATHFAALDAGSGGNFYFYGALTQSKNINNGDPAPSFAAGALDFALA